MNLIDEFTIHIRTFDSIIVGSPAPEKVKSKLEELKARANLSVDLTFWQKDAILGRCNNYLKGEYGSTSRTIKSMKEKASAN